MKRVWAVLTALLLSASVFAQEQEQEKKTPVLRYTGFSFGATALNQYALGDYGEFALCNAGGGLVLEYALPLAETQSWGFSAHGEFGYVVPKSGGIFKSDNEIRATAGIWWRVPFAIGNSWFAFQPELTAGAVIWSSKYDSESVAVSDKTNVNFLLGVAPAFRWMATPVFDVEVAPLFNLAPEKDANTMMIGARLGAVFHVQDAVVHKEDLAAAKAAKPAKEPKAKAEKAAAPDKAAKSIKPAKAGKGDLIGQYNDKRAQAKAQRELAAQKRSEVTDFASQSAANSEQIKKIEEQIAALTGRNETLAAEMQALKEELASLDKQSEEGAARKAEIDEKTFADKAETAENTKTIASLKKEIATLTKANAAIEKQSVAAGGAAEKADAAAEAADTAAENIMLQIIALRDSTAEEGRAQRTTEGLKRAESKELSAQVAANSEQIKKIEEQIATLTGRNETLAAEMQALKEELASLDKQSEEGAARKAEIDEKTSADKAETAENTKTIASLKKEIATLAKTNAAIEKQIAAADSAAEKAADLAETAENEARRLSGEIAAAQSALSASSSAPASVAPAGAAAETAVSAAENAASSTQE